MTINDKRPLNIQKFKDLLPGDVFEVKEKIYIKIINSIDLFYSANIGGNTTKKGCCNAFNLTENKIEYFNDDTFVVKLSCELTIKG